jgi:hypothetical protein
MTGLHTGEDLGLKTMQIPASKMAEMMISMGGVGKPMLHEEQIQSLMKGEEEAEIKAGTLVLPMPFEICVQGEEMPMQELVDRLLLLCPEAEPS